MISLFKLDELLMSLRDIRYTPLWCCSVEFLSHLWQFLIVFF